MCENVVLFKMYANYNIEESRYEGYENYYINIGHDTLGRFV